MISLLTSLWPQMTFDLLPKYKFVNPSSTEHSGHVIRLGCNPVSWRDLWIYCLRSVWPPFDPKWFLTYFQSTPLMTHYLLNTLDIFDNKIRTQPLEAEAFCVTSLVIYLCLTSDDFWPTSSYHSYQPRIWVITLPTLDKKRSKNLQTVAF